MGDYTTAATSMSFNHSSLSDTRKPVYYGLPFTIGMVCVALVASLITITGNVIVLISFILEKSIRQPSNYFIASLAVSDLLIGAISIPFYAAYLLAGHYWLLGEILCDLWLSIDYSACLCSIYTVFCITVDRYCSVKIPAKYRAWKTGKKILLIIAVIWTIPVVVFFTSIFGWQYFTGKRDLEVGECDVQYMKNAVFNSVLQIGYFWVTLVFMIALYASIYRVVLRLQRKSEKKRQKIARLVASASSAKPLKPQSTLLTCESTRGQKAFDRPEGGEHLSLCPIHSLRERLNERGIESYRNNDDVRQTLLNKDSSVSNKSQHEKLVNKGQIMEIDESSKNSKLFRENDEEEGGARRECIDERKETIDQQKSASKLPPSDKSPYAATKGNLKALDLCTSQQSQNQSECENALKKPTTGISIKQVNYGNSVSEKENNLKIKEESNEMKGICEGGGEDVFSKSHTTETLLCASPAGDLDGLRGNNAKNFIKNGENIIEENISDEIKDNDAAQCFNKCEFTINMGSNRINTLSKECDIIKAGQQSLFPKKKSNLLKKRKKSVDIKCNLKKSDDKLKIKMEPNFFERPTKEAQETDLERDDDGYKEASNDEETSRNGVQGNCLKVLRSGCCCRRQRSDTHQQVLASCTTMTTTTTTSTRDNNDQGRHFSKQPSRREDRAFKALRTITLILGAFVLCWTPWHLLSFVIGFCPSCVNSILYDISYWACYTNSPINPLCYAFANHQFKKTFIRIVRLDWQRT